MNCSLARYASWGCGPVVAAAAVFSVEAIEAGLPEALCDVNDSKKLSARKRAKLFEALDVFDGVEFGLSVVEPAEIDRINILQATHKAMHEALAALGQAVGCPYHRLPSMLRNCLVFTAALGLACSCASARELKEFDNDVNYDESRIPHYDLPDPLITAEGKPVTTAEQWRNVRRPQILSLFANFIYGAVPVPPEPIEQTYKVIKDDKAFMDGKATMLDVSIRFKYRKGAVQTHVVVFIPNDAKEPAPAFMMLSFDSPRGTSLQLSSSRKGRLRNGVPLAELIANGYGYVSVYHGDLIGHNEVSFGRGIHKLFFRDGQSYPKAHEWGVLGANALSLIHI